MRSSSAPTPSSKLPSRSNTSFTAMGARRSLTFIKFSSHTISRGSLYMGVPDSSSSRKLSAYRTNLYNSADTLFLSLSALSALSALSSLASSSLRTL